MTARDLTVVIPAHNTQEYVGEAIASVVEGADRLLELLVVDDGSTDRTGEIARSFGGPVRVLEQENGGVSAARNRGIAEARGRYVGFLDSDDLWAAARPDPRLRALDADPGLDVARGYCRYFVPGPDGERTLVLDPLGAHEMGAMIARRDVLRQVGGFDEEFRLAEDADLVLRLREAGHRILALDEITFLSRLRPGSLTRDRDVVIGSWMQAARAAMLRERERTQGSGASAAPASAPEAGP